MHAVGRNEDIKHGAEAIVKDAVSFPRRRARTDLLNALRAVSADDRDEAIKEALATLAEEERRREVMRRIEGMTTDEIAKLLGD